MSVLKFSEVERKEFISWVYQNHGCEIQEFYWDKPIGTMKRWKALNSVILTETLGPGDWEVFSSSTPPVIPQ
jgi:hypothetical protein